MLAFAESWTSFDTAPICKVNVHRGGLVRAELDSLRDRDRETGFFHPQSVFEKLTGDSVMQKQ
jgi:hypothetical protein